MSTKMRKERPYLGTLDRSKAPARISRSITTAAPPICRNLGKSEIFPLPDPLFETPI